MATKSVGTLAAQLLLDTTGWFVGFRKAQAAANSFTTVVGAKITATGTSMLRAAAAAATTAVSVHTLAKSFETIDRQAKLADRLGITVGQTQKLSLAADLAGTDVETLAKAMLHMGRTIGSGGKSLDQQFFAVADKIAKIEDPALRATAAFKAFGKGGMELINLLAQGGKGIVQSAAAIDRFGLALSRVDAAKVEEANDAWTVMKTVLTGVVNKVAVAFAPLITHGLNRMLTLLEGAQKAFGQLGIGWEHFALVATSSLEGTLRLGALITSQFIAAASAVNLLERGLLQVKFIASGFSDKGIAGEIASNRARAGELGRLHGEAIGIAFGTKGFKGGQIGIGGTGGRIGGEIGGLTSPKNQSPLEKGTKEAAIAVAAMGGNPIKSVEQHTANMLTVLERIDGRLAQPERARNAAEAHQMRMARL